VDKQGGKEVNVVEESVGDVTDGDVRRAQATNATIIAFKNKIEKGAKILADAQSVMIITSNIVYDLSRAVEDFLTGKLGPAAEAELEVLAVFSQDKLEKQLVGGRVTKGIFRGKSTFEIMRRAGAAVVVVGIAPVVGGAVAAGAVPVSAPAGNNEPAKSAGTGRVTSIHEKKTEIAQAEKGKEIGILAGSQTAIQIGDILVIRK
jgi:translation initiation factor IF-2